VNMPKKKLMTKARITELAEEAADCITYCQLGEECAFDYLVGFLTEVVEEATGVPRVKAADASSHLPDVTAPS
jgi:hypothetical protein